MATTSNPSGQIAESTLSHQDLIVEELIVVGGTIATTSLYWLATPLIIRQQLCRLLIFIAIEFAILVLHLACGVHLVNQEGDQTLTLIQILQPFVQV